MDRANAKVVRTMLGARPTPAVHLLRSFDASAPAGAEVPDPYSGGTARFDQVLDQCERACAGLLAHVQTQ